MVDGLVQVLLWVGHPCHRGVLVRPRSDALQDQDGLVLLLHHLLQLLGRAVHPPPFLLEGRLDLGELLEDGPVVGGTPAADRICDLRLADANHTTPFAEELPITDLLLRGVNGEVREVEGCMLRVLRGLHWLPGN